MDEQLDGRIDQSAIPAQWRQSLRKETNFHHSHGSNNLQIVEFYA
jgi:hypothetical protein